MAQVSIPKGMFDPFYRYKRIVLNLAGISAKGGRIRIDKKQFSLLCKQIDRKEDMILQYLKKKIGVSMIINKNYIEIGKSLSIEEFDDMIEKYIIKYIICNDCGNPETKIENNRTICMACGSIH